MSQVPEERVLPQSAVELRHAESAPEGATLEEKGQTTFFTQPVGAGRTGRQKSPTQCCELASVLPGGRRIEVHPDFDTNTFERLVNSLQHNCEAQLSATPPPARARSYSVLPNRERNCTPPGHEHHP